MKPQLLDLFCGAGGAAMGYHLAGFDVVGVDNRPMPRYPFQFHRADALEVLADREFLSGFDAIHASPPCQANTTARVLQGRDHADLIPVTRRLLRASGLPYVIENVPGASLINPFRLCGTEFGLTVLCPDGRVRELRRHRLFEASFPALSPGGCRHRHPAVSVFGHGGGRSAGYAGRSSYQGPIAVRRSAMGIDWMNRDELSEAIPSVYCQFVGEQLMAHLKEKPRAELDRLKACRDVLLAGDPLQTTVGELAELDALIKRVAAAHLEAEVRR